MNKTTILPFLALFAFTECGQTNSQTHTNMNIMNNETKAKTENMNIEKTLIDSSSAVTGNNQFAQDLFKKYINSDEQKDKNIFFSPYSIYSALAMTSEGAIGQTALEIQNVLHLPENAGIRHSGFENLMAAINSGSTNYKLTAANALWTQKEYKFLPAFLNINKSIYKANAENLDFVNHPETALKTINTWVEENTNNKIKDLLSENNITKYTRLILTNTIYFKAEWALQFEAEYTKEDDFKASNGSSIKTQMMHIQRAFPYSETAEAQVLEMPYKNNELSMIVILPKTGQTINSISRNINRNTFLSNTTNYELLLVSFPRFKIEAKYLMKEDLTKMGMALPFTDKADFSGMTGTKDLQINQVIHQTFVEVNEAGTEAAAATAVGMEAGCAPRRVEPKQFNANHPFIFAIRQNYTGAILFMGVLNNPK